jgi:hypothetical protein
VPRGIKSLEVQTFPQVLHTKKGLHLKAFDPFRRLINSELRWIYVGHISALTAPIFSSTYPYWPYTLSTTISAMYNVAGFFLNKTPLFSIFYGSLTVHSLGSVVLRFFYNAHVMICRLQKNIILVTIIIVILYVIQMKIKISLYM